MTKGMSSARIAFHLDVHEPIELDDLISSFQAVASEYKDFITEKMRKSGKTDKEPNVTLYVTDISNNCILADLASSTEIMGQFFDTLDQLETFKGFVGIFSDAIKLFRNITSAEHVNTSDFPYSKKTAKSIAKILNTVGKKKSGSLNLSVVDIDKKTKKRTNKLSRKFSNNEVSKANKGAEITIKAFEDAEKKVSESKYENVLMQLHQASKEEPKSEGKTAFRGIIKNIQDADLPVNFVSLLDCARIDSIIKDPIKNPFTASYFVDVNVEVNLNGKPISYRITKIHDIVANDDKKKK